MSVDILTLDGMEPALGAEGGEEGKGLISAHSSHLRPESSTDRLTFSVQGCPQSLQSRLEEAPRREEVPPEAPSVILDRGWRRLPAAPLAPSLERLCYFLTLFVSHCGSSNKPFCVCV